ncbi:MAG: glutathione S-transferase family protein [Proteobacteria bacterium]|nr:glutathione S-transferase family protein [Pseudomonadota bacterium]
MDQQLELVSFKFCPFVQRNIIIAKEKGVDIKVTHINLKEPPQWFLDISPFKKVPLLRVGDVVLFESTAIAEYLDELSSPSLHPDNALVRATNRAWIVAASELFMSNARLIKGKTEQDFNDACANLTKQLDLLEPLVKGPYFNGDTFSLIDAAYAPLFLRLDIINQVYPLKIIKPGSNIEKWSKQLLITESVQQSVIDNFADAYKNWVAGLGGYCASLLTETA